MKKIKENAKYLKHGKSVLKKKKKQALINNIYTGLKGQK